MGVCSGTTRAGDRCRNQVARDQTWCGRCRPPARSGEPSPDVRRRLAQQALFQPPPPKSWSSKVVGLTHDVDMTQTAPQISISTDGGQVRLASPYHPKLPALARALGGRFDGSSRTWTFDRRDEARVHDLARQVYGTDGTPTETVTVRWCPPFGACASQELYFAGRQIAYRPGRDSPVRLGDGVVIVEGKLPSSGGSARNPALASYGESPVVFEIRDIPAGHPDIADLEVVGEAGPAVNQAHDGGADTATGHSHAAEQMLAGTHAAAKFAAALRADGNAALDAVGPVDRDALAAER